MNEFTLRNRTIDKCVANFVSYSCHLSQVEPTKVKEALQDESWVKVMHDELLQFQRNDFGLWYLDRRVSTSSAQSGYFAIKLMRRVM